MELNDSTRSSIYIDLNQIPTSSTSSIPESKPDSVQIDSLNVVRSFHKNHESKEPVAALLEEEKRDEEPCGACGKTVEREKEVACDGCERVFHLKCVAGEEDVLKKCNDWICEECASNGAKSKRWPLGFNDNSKKIVLDINSSPPSDDERGILRNHAMDDNSANGNMFGASVAFSNHFHVRNGFEHFNHSRSSGSEIESFREGFEDVRHQTYTVDRNIEVTDLDFPLGRDSSSIHTSIRPPSHRTNEILLQGLKEFISERHGILDEGWHVELKHLMSGYIAYCSPDGKIFGSMSEVACYLGLESSCKAMDTDTRTDGSPPLQEAVHLPKKKKSKRFSCANGSVEINELTNDCHRGLLSNGHQSSEVGDTAAADLQIEDHTNSMMSDEGFPVQFEDFFVISLGKIDGRPSYHEHQLIWPVGYKSRWHDRVTGSLFVCEVLDGGDSGPVFQIKRFSCSAMPLPNGSTILCMKDPDLSAGLNSNEHNDELCDDIDCDNDSGIEAILADASAPTETDIMACLGQTSNETCSIQTSESLQHDSLHSEHGRLSSSRLQMADDIGEFTVEERSSSSAWRLVSEKLVDFYSKSCKQEVIFKLYCRHVDNKTWSPSWDKEKWSIINFAPLAKFCSSPNLLGIPLEYQGGVDSLAATILKWLDQDRFGLDADFVQEVIEQLPGVGACSNYEFLADRSNYSVSSTVGNGLLMAKRKNGAELEDSLQRSKRPRLERNCDADDHDPPLGRLLCSRLPPVLAGDLYQVWEFLRRFQGILGLKDIWSLEQLEEELIDLQSKFTDDCVIDLDQVGSMRGPKFTSCQKSPNVITGDTSHVFVQVDRGGTTDLSQDEHVFDSHKKCAGLALTDIHSSLLSVLIGELQSKVAAIVDPNSDSGELKSKRGRKKDVDSLTSIRRNRLTTLPINEMTWPELARRYILAFLSMEGNLDSSEITARESAKVFRCLQGDGGVLCGSLTGVAGMEADALLLAEATKQIYGSLSREKDVLTMEDEDTASGSCENSMNGSNIPEWALVLEPVKKLPTNVGARIRNCVYEALGKGPPEWAKKRLEYSISKDVYKGNASGPTKRAVLSVLAEISGEGLPQKPEKRNKRKITIPVSDITMKQCRIILRRVAANDDGKVFCTLLGRNITHSSDHEDEGLLGSPAMISRPLDFRTIDLRLAVDAYGGSHDSFLEDVQELWKNVHTAFGEQSDVIELVEKLSKNFESLYEKEVVTLIQKLEIFAKLDCLNAETKKELDNILASTNEIPIAPWDEGVCKVCGVDKDDNSVLLCDTCDAGYHTYCLNPPLARIPEGNWYCPSCVGVHVFQEASVRTQVMGQTLHKKNQEGITCAYLETLMDLATVIEEKDYGDFSVDERTFLLKFLCDEFLGSAFVRQHLEQCAEITSELQQILRSLYVEWKNLKSREEFLALRSTKMNSGASVVVKEGLASASTDQGKSVGQPPDLSQRSRNFFDGVRSAEGSRVQIGVIGLDKQPFELNCEKKTGYDSQTDDLMDTRGQVKDFHVFANGINTFSKEISNPLRKRQLLSNHAPQLDQMNDSPTLDDLKRNVHRNTSTCLPPSDHSGSSLVLGMNSVENVSSVNCESQGYHTELRTIKDDILRVQHLISRIESQLLRQSMRREFLGSDSRGRLYWASETYCGHPQIIVDGSLTFHSTERSDHWFSNGSVLQHSASGIDCPLNLEGSGACFPFLFNLNNGGDVGSAWVSYETDAEIEELINWLGHEGQKGIELKNAIRQWLKVSSQEIQQTIDPIQEEECQANWSMIGNNITTAFSNCLVTKAELFLEKRHGAPCELDASDLLKKRGKKSRGTNDEKTYRCDCLELIWLSRFHCNSCHRTFSSDVELKGHNNGKCSSVSQPLAKSEEVNGLSKGRGSVKAEVSRKENISETDKTRSVLSEIDSRLIKFRNRGIKHPYGLSDVCTKFVTKDSNKELVQEIGLIGSNGIPSFVISMSPYVSDSVVMLTSPEKDSKILQYVSDLYQREVVAQGKRSTNNTGAENLSDKENLSDNCTKKTSVDESIQVLKINKPSLVCMKQRGKKYSSDDCLPEIPGHYSLVSEFSLKPQASFLLRRLKINLLDMEAALPEEALRPSKGHLEQRWAWRAFVKSAVSIYQMVLATIMLEELIKTEYLRNEWWYWSSISAAAKSSTIASLALRIYALDACVIYEKTYNSDPGPGENLKPNSLVNENLLRDSDSVEKGRVTRKSNRKRKGPEDSNCWAKSNGS